MKKTGIFGGLFDPPHIGHLITALDALIELNLDEIWFLVSFHPPHRGENAPFDRRYEMTRLSVQDFRKFKTSPIEKELNLDKSYSLLVIREIKKRFMDRKFYFIIGSDQFKRFNEWYKPEEVLKEMKVAVLKRKEEDFNGYPFAKDVIFLHNRCMEISSSEIRKRVKEGKEIKFFVRDAVEEYILREKLYR